MSEQTGGPGRGSAAGFAPPVRAGALGFSTYQSAMAAARKNGYSSIIQVQRLKLCPVYAATAPRRALNSSRNRNNDGLGRLVV
jgi:hypothetical protein